MSRRYVSKGGGVSYPSCRHMATNQHHIFLRKAQLCNEALLETSGDKVQTHPLPTSMSQLLGGQEVCRKGRGPGEGGNVDKREGPREGGGNVDQGEGPGGGGVYVDKGEGPGGGGM